MKQIEYEERVLLSKSDYEKVIDDVKNEGRTIVLTKIKNTYLDNIENYIIKTKKMLRIREIDNGLVELTLKIKRKDGSNIEINESLDNHPLIDKELPDSFKNYKPIAELITERMEIKYPDYLLVIDKNVYHGKVDYDLEIESKNQQKCKQIINIYCQKYNLLYNPNYQNKVQRAIQQANKK